MSDIDNSSDSVMTEKALAELGAPKIVYVRPMLAGDLRDEVPGLESIPDDMMLYSVHAADGTRMAVMDDRDTAFTTARENQMEPVSVH